MENDRRIIINYHVYPADTTVKIENKPGQSETAPNVMYDITQPDSKGNGVIEVISRMEFKWTILLVQYLADGITKINNSKPAEITMTCKYDKPIEPTLYFVKGQGEWTNNMNPSNSGTMSPIPHPVYKTLPGTQSIDKPDIRTYSIELGDGESHYILFDKGEGKDNAYFNVSPLSLDYGVLPEGMEVVLVELEYNGIKQPAIRLSGGKDIIKYTRVKFDHDLFIDVNINRTSNVSTTNVMTTNRDDWVIGPSNGSGSDVYFSYRNLPDEIISQFKGFSTNYLYFREKIYRGDGAVKMDFSGYSTVPSSVISSFMIPGGGAGGIYFPVECFPRYSIPSSFSYGLNSVDIIYDLEFSDIIDDTARVYYLMDKNISNCNYFSSHYEWVDKVISNSRVFYYGYYGTSNVQEMCDGVEVTLKKYQAHYNLFDKYVGGGCTIVNNNVIFGFGKGSGRWQGQYSWVGDWSTEYYIAKNFIGDYYNQNSCGQNRIRWEKIGASNSPIDISTFNDFPFMINGVSCFNSIENPTGESNDITRRVKSVPMPTIDTSPKQQKTVTYTISYKTFNSDNKFINLEVKYVERDSHMNYRGGSYAEIEGETNWEELK